MIELFLPEGILAYFELVGGGNDAEGFKISLEEKNIPPEEYKDEVLHSKGFYPEIKVQDFRIRGKKVQLCIKRRRWEVRSTSAIVSQDWTLVRAGTRMTTEYALFLKGIFV